jgi:hypothetical protein
MWITVEHNFGELFSSGVAHTRPHDQRTPTSQATGHNAELATRPGFAFHSPYAPFANIVYFRLLKFLEYQKNLDGNSEMHEYRTAPPHPTRFFFVKIREKKIDRKRDHQLTPKCVIFERGYF